MDKSNVPQTCVLVTVSWKGSGALTQATRSSNVNLFLGEKVKIIYIHWLQNCIHSKQSYKTVFFYKVSNETSKLT